jgi:hypothetical protein
LDKRGDRKHLLQLRRDKKKKADRLVAGHWKPGRRSPNDPVTSTKEREASRVEHLTQKKSRAKLRSEKGA